MLIKTHLAVAIFLGIILSSAVSSQITFILALLIASVIPDIDTAQSSVGKYKLLRPIQWLTKHRGIIHSFTLAIILSAIVAIFLPAAAFGFFLGYALHILLDSFTEMGVYLFWPLKSQAKWKIKTGGYIDSSIFITFMIIDLVLIVSLLFL